MNTHVSSSSYDTHVSSSSYDTREGREERRRVLCC
jgi:hypothetical protein